MGITAVGGADPIPGDRRPDEVQKGDIIGTADVDHFHGIDTNGKQRAATFRRPGHTVRRYIRTAERRGN
jgi:hypothetical protein